MFWSDAEGVMSVLSVEKVLWMKEGEGLRLSAGSKDSEFFTITSGVSGFAGVLALEMLKQTAEKYLEALSGQSGKADTLFP